jgi:hypothetical protein
MSKGRNKHNKNKFTDAQPGKKNQSNRKKRNKKQTQQFSEVAKAQAHTTHKPITSICGSFHFLADLSSPMLIT